ncbi:MAG: Micrococcal nuclease [Microgenomates group bacterium Gr01-1014_7]|nr:MAG: Micrococcal nuclease [Microgenomates group bacterium Gr01-1014_7]
MPELITVPDSLLKDILLHIKDSSLEKKIKDLLENTDKYQSQNISYFPKKGKVKRVVDGDTVVLENGSIVRYVGITAPETNEPFEKESTEENKRLVEGKSVSLEYDNYKGDKFGRILAYLFIDGKNVSIELARKGLAQVVIYQHKKPFIYAKELQKAQEEAKKKKLGIWSK